MIIRGRAISIELGADAVVDSSPHDWIYGIGAKYLAVVSSIAARVQ
jgi:hypothetical protein